MGKLIDCKKTTVQPDEADEIMTAFTQGKKLLL